MGDFLNRFGPLILATIYAVVWVLASRENRKIHCDGDPSFILLFWVFSLMPVIGWVAHLVLPFAIEREICQRRTKEEQLTDDIFDEI